MSWLERVKTNSDILGSFIIPIVIMSLVYALHGMYPVGAKTILICDMNGQYVDFYAAFHDILTQGKSLLFSWEAGMGFNTLGLFAYYLSSPFSLLILLFDKQNLTEALFLITLLKIGTAGLMFAVLARYLVKGTRVSILMFSVLYALMSYSIVYSFNIMWLDGVIFLPLVILGTEKIVRENKFFLFFISLVIIFFANFYIAYMVGVFSLLYFIVRFFSEHQWQARRLFLRKLGFFLASAVLAAGCTSFLWIPTYFALAYGQGGPEFSMFSWSINFKLFDLLSKLQLGSYDTLKFQGLPNIFSGLLPLVLMPLFFLSGKIALKEKLLYLSLFTMLIFSFNFYNVDLIWHGFDKPDWFLYRYSFVFSFLMIVLSYRSFNLLQASDIPKVFRISLVWVILIILLQKFDYDYLSDRLLIISLFLIGIYYLLLYGLAAHLHLNKKNAILIALACLIFMEVFLNSWYLVRRLDGEFGYTAKEDYRGKLAELESIIPQIEVRDDSFYRLDRIGGRSFNDPLNLNYKGITHFSSMSNIALHRFLRQLGFLSTASYKSVNFAGSTPITESLLAVKYVISAQKKGLGYEAIFSQDNYQVFENNYPLPLGFMVSSKLKELDITQNNPFQLQNDLVNLAQGNELISPDYLDFFVPIDRYEVELNNVYITTEKGREIYAKINEKEEGWVEFTIVNPKEQQVYACFDSINIATEIHLNDKIIGGYLPISNKRILDLGFHLKDEILKLKVSFKSGEFALVDKFFYGLNEVDLSKAVTPLQEEMINIIGIADTSVSATILATEDGLLFTSIPYDPGWTVLVDGEEFTISKIGDSLMAIELTRGEHLVEFTFWPRGLTQGLLFTGFSFMVLFGFLYLMVRQK